MRLRAAQHARTGIAVPDVPEMLHWRGSTTVAQAFALVCKIRLLTAF
jgi:hypothetical protein